MKNKVVTKLNLVMVGVIGILFLMLMIKVRSVKDEHATVELLVSGPNGWSQQTQLPPAWLVDSIKVGDKEVAYSGKVTAQVMQVDTFEEGANKVGLVKMEMVVVRDKITGTYRYKTKNIEVGGVLDMGLGKTRFYGTVVDIGDNQKWVEKTVKIKMRMKEPSLAVAIKNGDRVGAEREVLESSFENAKVTVLGVVREDPLYRDIETTLKMRLIEREGVMYFAYYQPVKVGNKLYIPMKDYNLYDAEVEEVKDAN